MRIIIDTKTVVLAVCGVLLLSIMYGYLPVMGDKWADPDAPEYMESTEYSVEGEMIYPEDSIPLQRGLWYSPYVKIYSIGGDDRIVEISNYPRAYKDTTPHVYTRNVKFNVTEDDLNFEIDGELVYIDSREQIFREGDKATHYTGDSLPGAFPLWIESEDLPFTGVFDVSAIPGTIFDMCNETLRMTVNGRDVYVKIADSAMVDKIREGMLSGEIRAASPGKMIIRIQYKRIM